MCIHLCEDVWLLCVWLCVVCVRCRQALCLPVYGPVPESLYIHVYIVCLGKIYAGVCASRVSLCVSAYVLGLPVYLHICVCVWPMRAPVPMPCMWAMSLSACFPLCVFACMCCVCVCLVRLRVWTCPLPLHPPHHPAGSAQLGPGDCARPPVG